MMHPIPIEELTVDKLRKLGGYPHYLGLGVIKCRLKDDLSYHFYSERSPAIVDNIHEHRFGFTSTVLKGRLKNIIYDVDGSNPESTLQVERGECRPGVERVIEVENAKIIELCSFITPPGESYHIESYTLHRIQWLTDKGITFLEKEPVVRIDPRFVEDISKPRVCAMSQPKSKEECWEIIEFTLQD